LFSAAARAPWLNAKIQWNMPTRDNPMPFRVSPIAQAVDTMNVRHTLGDTSGSNILQMLGGKLKKGDVEIEFPAAGSKTVEEAAAWLEESRSKVMNFVDKSESVSLETQTKQAVDLLNDLIVAARASLKDEALQAHIDLTIRPQTFAELKAFYGSKEKKLTGEPLYQNILDESFKQTQKIMDDIIAQAKAMEVPDEIHRGGEFRSFSTIFAKPPATLRNISTRDGSKCVPLPAMMMRSASATSSGGL
jgi:hypothetical protein